MLNDTAKHQNIKFIAFLVLTVTYSKVREEVSILYITRNDEISKVCSAFPIDPDSLFLLLLCLKISCYKIVLAVEPRNTYFFYLPYMVVVRNSYNIFFSSLIFACSRV